MANRRCIQLMQIEQSSPGSHQGHWLFLINSHAEAFVGEEIKEWRTDKVRFCRLLNHRDSYGLIASLSPSYGITRVMEHIRARLGSVEIAFLKDMSIPHLTVQRDILSEILWGSDAPEDLDKRYAATMRLWAEEGDLIASELMNVEDTLFAKLHGEIEEDYEPDE